MHRQCRVRTHPGKYWNLIIRIPCFESSGILSWKVNLFLLRLFYHIWDAPYLLITHNHCNVCVAKCAAAENAKINTRQHIDRCDIPREKCPENTGIIFLCYCTNPGYTWMLDTTMRL